MLAPEELRRRQLAALTNWVMAGAKVQPVVLALEDLHWADPTTGTISAGSSLTWLSELSRSARRRSMGTSAPPKRSWHRCSTCRCPRIGCWRPHSAIGCSGVFCKSCEQLHSTQVCGMSASR